MNEKKKLLTRDLTLIAFMAVMIAVCSWISIPLGPVPFTLQTMGVMLTLGILGGKKGTLSVIVWIALGLVGVPVFSGFKAGAGVLLGVTGGYIIGFVFMGLIYWAITSIFGKSLSFKLIAFVAGLFVCYLFGSVWFMAVYGMGGESISMADVLAKCVFPFLIPEVGKIGLAVVILSRLPQSIVSQS